jgi:hypothetical protein
MPTHTNPAQNNAIPRQANKIQFFSLTADTLSRQPTSGRRVKQKFCGDYYAIQAPTFIDDLAHPQ